MKITIDRKELLRFFSALTKITKIDSSTFVRFIMDGPKIEIVFIMGTTKISHVIYGHGDSLLLDFFNIKKEFFVDVRILEEYIKLETAGVLELDVSNYNTLIIKNVHGEYCIPVNEDVFDIEDPSRSPGDDCIVFKTETFITGGNIVSPFASKEKRSRISSVFVMVNEKYSAFVATDGYVLAEYRKNYMFDKITQASENNFKSIAIPLHAFQAIESFIGEEIDAIKFYQEELLDPDDLDEENRFVAHVGMTKISFVSAGHYPDYLNLYPGYIYGSAIVDRKKLINLCKKIKLFCISGSATFSLDYKLNNITIFANEVEGIEYSAEDKIEAAMNNSSKFILNAGVVADALNKIKVNSPKYDMVTLDYGMEGDKKPVIFKAYSAHPDTTLIVLIAQPYDPDDEVKTEEEDGEV